MEHIALYRKYRPKVFEDLVGQSNITETLINQINNNRLSHAYLFSGPRGTGKTSSAKIISRYANCLEPNKYNPCNICDNCKQILNDSFLDVIEMDAASHNGVDDIRELTDGIRYSPSIGKKKVIIIDEVHMLSKGAFNALLKTLEEPPHYVIFILATTEPEKIPQTIISRCQSFDFKRISSEDMSKYLAKVSSLEGININEDALMKISKQSGGAMRDALGLLEKVFSSSYKTIDSENLGEIIGSSEDDVENLVYYLIKSDIIKVLEISSNIYYSGKDIKNIKQDMIEFLRKGMLYSSGVSNKVSELKQREIEFFEKIDAKNYHKFFVYSLGEFIEATKNRYFDNVRASFEFVLASICNKSGSDKKSGLEARLELIENQIKELNQKISEGSIAIKNFESDKSRSNNIENIKTENNFSDFDINAEFSSSFDDENNSDFYEDFIDSFDSTLDEEFKDEKNYGYENKIEEDKKENKEEKTEEPESLNFGGKSWDEVLEMVKDKNAFAFTVICTLEPISFKNSVLVARFPENLKALSIGFESGGLDFILKESIESLCNEDVEINIVD